MSTSRRKRPAPRQRVTDHLWNLGFSGFDADDIHFTQGGIHKLLNDVVECWGLFCLDPSGKKVEIRSAHTLTQCAAGIELIPNTRDSDLYGDLIAEPKPRKSQTPKRTRQ